MKIASFLKLVEIQTKTASILPFLFGTVFAWQRYHSFRLVPFLLMFFSLFCVDMATTALNNYLDYKRAVQKSGFGYEEYNAIVRDRLANKHVLIVIVVLFSLAVGAGIGLLWQTDLTVLLLGALAFTVAIMYSAGPLPISRTPFGELFSGSLMGFLIPFIAIYIQTDVLLVLTFTAETIELRIQWQELLVILLMAWPLVTAIANIMLANNICDLEEDLPNKRYTLPHHIGVPGALALLRFLYYSNYIAVLIPLLLKQMRWPNLLFFLTLPIVEKNTRAFAEKQDKSSTFVLAVQNFLVISLGLILTLVISLL